MKKGLYCKILAVGIIVLFVGVSITSAVYNEDKVSTSENENLLTKYGDIYENTNCFVMGSTSESFNGVLFYGEGDIEFGWKWSSESHPSHGWIYTNGDNGKWIYHSLLKGKFYGDVSSYQSKDWWSGLWVTYYVGVEGFRGLALGGHPWQGVNEEPSGAISWFVGHADHVKIRSA